MKSIGFEKFLQEFNSSGKEKIDGYTHGHFDQMTNPERNHAFQLLSQELKQSAVAIDPLFYIDKLEACTIFEDKYLTDKKTGNVNFHLIAKLWLCQKSDIYAEEFLQCYDSVSEYSLIAYINDAATIDHQKSNDVLAKIIVDSEKEYVRRHAAKTLALKMEITDEVEKRQFVNSVTVENSHDRKLALAKEIEKRRKI